MFVPYRSGQVGSLSLALCRRCPQLVHKDGLPISSAQACTNSGTSDRRYSADGDKPKRPSVSLVNTPTLANARRIR